MNSTMELPLLQLLTPRRAYPAPSLRIAANRQNRSLLRWLRAAELSAWQGADARHVATTRGFQIKFLPKTLFKMQSR
jgi:hypothetical protein